MTERRPSPAGLPGRPPAGPDPASADPASADPASAKPGAAAPPDPVSAAARAARPPDPEAPPRRAYPPEQPGAAPRPVSLGAPSRRGARQFLAVQPLPLLLMGVSGLAMLVPATHGLAGGDRTVASAFGGTGALVLLLALMAGLALSGRRRAAAPGAQLGALVAAYLLLPLLLAVPFVLARPGTGWGAAWFEMVSALTTTGATLWSDPAQLPGSLHLWRALVGWLGGLLVLVTAAAVFQPLRLGGFEVLDAGAGRPPAAGQAGDPGARILRFGAALAPVYLSLTAALWLALVMAGDGALVALCHAMGVLSTSGISPVAGGVAGAASGRTGELLVLLFLVFALSRRALAPAGRGGGPAALLADPELRLGLLLVLGTAGILFVRQWGGGPVGGPDVAAPLRAVWGAVFSAASFLTTTGYVSADWVAAQHLTGIGAPGLVLMGLAVLGGGVATTAGGVKLLRVLALYHHGRRELERLLEPHSVGGGGMAARQMRGPGAAVAFVFFLLFALSCGGVMLALTLTGLELDEALVFAVAALSTTGQLALVAGDLPLSYADLDAAGRILLGLAMVLGRIETLALIALLSPGIWRR